MGEILSYLTTILIALFWLLGVFIFLKFIFGKNIENYHSNWNTLIDGFDYSPLEFYKLLKAELKSHGIKKLEIVEEVKKEGGVMSHSRIYLRATWKNYQYDICGAKFGKGFFVSWWLLYKNSIGKLIIGRIPLVGPWIAEKLYPITYYQIDTASMFMTYCQSSVLKVIDDITNGKGVKAMTENERKPILNNIFSR